MSLGGLGAHFDEHIIWIELGDGRTLDIPLAWFPSLLKATPTQCDKIESNLVDLLWGTIDEDISIEELLAGRGDGTGPEHAA